MSTLDTERFSFEAEWYDKVSCSLKKFYLYYFPSDNSVELYDIKTRKTFLRRSKCSGLETKDFYVGSIVTIFSRSLKITNFADQATKEKLSSKVVRTFAIIKSNVIYKLGEILKSILDHDFHISNIRMGTITHDNAVEVFMGDDQYPAIIDCITEGPIVALELLGKHETSKWPELSFVFEKQGVNNGIYILNNKEKAQSLFTTEKSKKSILQSSAKLQFCTCCIIKPHAVQAELVSPIIDDIQKNNFIISAMQQFYIDPVNAEEFLEVYKGVLPDYAAMVSELQSGPCIVMEITHKDENYDVVTEFRKFCGPMDPEMAKQLRPNTLRAKYGKTRIQNAVHCSDLQEDGLLEVEYFFKILSEN